MTLLEQIESRLAVCAKATPGEWYVEDDQLRHRPSTRWPNGGRIIESCTEAGDFILAEDGPAIAASRNQREGELAALKVAVEALGKLSVRSFKGTDCANYPAAEFASASEMVRECLEALAQITKLMAEGG